MRNPLTSRRLTRPRILPTIVAPRRSHSFTVITIVATWLAAHPAVAEEPKRITAAEFVERFQKSDPRFEGLQGRLEAARAEALAARLLPNPSVAYDREEVFASSQAFPENYVRLALPVEISGRRGKRIDATEAGARASAAETERARFLLTLDALDLYHDAAALRLRVAMLRERRDALATLLTAVRARTSAGDASGYDLSRLELELASYDDLLSEAEQALTATRRSLATLLGEPGAMVDAEDPLELPARPASVTKLARTSLTARGDYQGSLRRVEQAEHELSSARRAWVPTLQLSGGLKTSYLGTETATGYTAGLALSLPLFDHGQAERARAIANKKLALSEARTLERAVPLAVQNTYDELTLRLGQATRYEKEHIPKLDALIRRAEVSYREGERPVFELLDAYRTAREVRLRYLDLRREAKRSELKLWRALGRKP